VSGKCVHASDSTQRQRDARVLISKKINLVHACSYHRKSIWCTRAHIKEIKLGHACSYHRKSNAIRGGHLRLGTPEEDQLHTMPARWGPPVRVPAPPWRGALRGAPRRRCRHQIWIADQSAGSRPPRDGRRRLWRAFGAGTRVRSIRIGVPHALFRREKSNDSHREAPPKEWLPSICSRAREHVHRCDSCRQHNCWMFVE